MFAKMPRPVVSLISNNRVLRALYGLYISTLASIFALALFSFAWKRKTILQNLTITEMKKQIRNENLFLYQFYYDAAQDLFRFLHGVYGKEIFIREKDRKKLNSMQTNGGLLLTAHFHHWEFMGSWLSQQGIALQAIALPLKITWANNLLRKLRCRIGLKIYSENIAHEAKNFIAQKNTLGFLWDQRYDQNKKQSRTQTLFFQQTISLNPLPLYLYKQIPMPIYFATLLPHGQIRICEYPIGYFQSPEDLIKNYHRWLESLIRIHPTFWYGWAHRRWKI